MASTDNEHSPIKVTKRVANSEREAEVTRDLAAIAREVLAARVQRSDSNLPGLPLSAQPSAAGTVDEAEHRPSLELVLAEFAGRVSGYRRGLDAPSGSSKALHRAMLYSAWLKKGVPPAVLENPLISAIIHAPNSQAGASNTPSREDQTQITPGNRKRSLPISPILLPSPPSILRNSFNTFVKPPMPKLLSQTTQDLRREYSLNSPTQDSQTQASPLKPFPFSQATPTSQDSLAHLSISNLLPPNTFNRPPPRIQQNTQIPTLSQESADEEFGNDINVDEDEAGDHGSKARSLRPATRTKEAVGSRSGGGGGLFRPGAGIREAGGGRSGGGDGRARPDVGSSETDYGDFGDEMLWTQDLDNLATSGGSESRKKTDTATTSKSRIVQQLRYEWKRPYPSDKPIETTESGVPKWRFQDEFNFMAGSNPGVLDFDKVPEDMRPYLDEDGYWDPKKLNQELGRVACPLCKQFNKSYMKLAEHYHSIHVSGAPSSNGDHESKHDVYYCRYARFLGAICTAPWDEVKRFVQKASNNRPGGLLRRLYDFGHTPHHTITRTGIPCRTCGSSLASPLDAALHFRSRVCEAAQSLCERWKLGVFCGFRRPSALKETKWPAIEIQKAAKQLPSNPQFDTSLQISDDITIVMPCRHSNVRTKSCEQDKDNSLKLAAEHARVFGYACNVTKLCGEKAPSALVPILPHQADWEGIIRSNVIPVPEQAFEFSTWLVYGALEFSSGIFDLLEQQPDGKRIIFAVEDSFTCQPSRIAWTCATQRSFKLVMAISANSNSSPEVMKSEKEYSQAAKLWLQDMEQSARYRGVYNRRHWMELDSDAIASEWVTILQEREVVDHGEEEQGRSVGAPRKNGLERGFLLWCEWVQGSKAQGRTGRGRGRSKSAKTERTTEHSTLQEAHILTDILDDLLLERAAEVAVEI